MGGYFSCKTADIDEALSHSLDSGTVEVEGITDSAALNEWQKACLLSWYGFHQYPGEGHTARVAVLVRKAYQYGLHQIDNEANRTSYGWDFLSEEWLEDWRRVWWCLYFLDCYVSFSAGIPHQVELQSVRTALLRHSPLSELSQGFQFKIYVPPDLASLWETILGISAMQSTEGFSLHLAVSNLLKEALIIDRLHKQNPCQSARQRMSILEDHLFAVQLSLPTNYLRCTQDLPGEESDSSYHSRLLVLLKFFSTRFLVRYPWYPLDANEWATRWQETLEICYRITAILQRWDAQYLRAVDPAVGFIALSSLVCLHLHSFSTGIFDAPLREQLDRRKRIVRLFLQRYATYWSLPRLLLGKSPCLSTCFAYLWR
jgi:hypothetical protein